MRSHSVGRRELPRQLLDPEPLAHVLHPEETVPLTLSTDDEVELKPLFAWRAVRVGCPCCATADVETAASRRSPASVFAFMVNRILPLSDLNQASCL
ncbi:MAG: hypothetical protein N2C14_03285 [Planctomycetales bacterium]